MERSMVGVGEEKGIKKRKCWMGEDDGINKRRR